MTVAEEQIENCLMWIGIHYGDPTSPEYLGEEVSE